MKHEYISWGMYEARVYIMRYLCSTSIISWGMYEARVYIMRYLCSTSIYHEVCMQHEYISWGIYAARVYIMRYVWSTSIYHEVCMKHEYICPRYVCSSSTIHVSWGMYAARVYIISYLLWGNSLCRTNNLSSTQISWDGHTKRRLDFFTVVMELQSHYICKISRVANKQLCRWGEESTPCDPFLNTLCASDFFFISKFY